MLVLLDVDSRVDFTVEHAHVTECRVRSHLRLVSLEHADRRVRAELADTREQILANLDEDFVNEVNQNVDRVLQVVMNNLGLGVGHRLNRTYLNEDESNDRIGLGQQNYEPHDELALAILEFLLEPVAHIMINEHDNCKLHDP